MSAFTCVRGVGDECCRKTRGWSADPSLFMCVSMLARALGPEVLVNVKDLLPSMLATGLRLVSNGFLRHSANALKL